MRSNDLIKIIDWIPKTWQHLNSFLEAHSSSDVTIGNGRRLSNTYKPINTFDWVSLSGREVRYLIVSLLGPRLFLSCPMDADGSRVWFTDLWNYSLVPYLLEAVREGLQVHMQQFKANVHFFVGCYNDSNKPVWFISLAVREEGGMGRPFQMGDWHLPLELRLSAARRPITSTAEARGCGIRRLQLL